MHVNAYLNFNGNCEAAFRFYAETLGEKPAQVMKVAGSPAESHMPAESRDNVLHAEMKIGETVLMGADVPPNHFQKPQGFGVTLHTKSAEEAEKVFAALSQGGTIQMAMGKTFFAERFGQTTDQFGIPWMVICAGAR